MLHPLDLARSRKVATVGLLWLFGLILAGIPGASAAGNHVELLNVDGTITPVMRNYIHSGISRAEKSGATAVVLRLDTPGGLSSAMDDIVQDILNSTVPVIVYVGPPGARAASAGVYIAYAAHVAAMAPSTNIGSATPVFVNQSGQPTSADATLTNKVVNDAVARMRYLANLRGRNGDWGEQAVRNAVNITADEALQQNVIDLIAPNIPTLLNEVDGQTVQMASGQISLQTRNATIRTDNMTLPEQLLQTISDPTIAYLLLSVGMIGIFFELANPGAILPGVAGGISLLLGLSSLGNLAPNWAGVLLMCFAFVLFLIDLYVPSHGVLTIGGIASFAFGSFMLSNSVGTPTSGISRLAIITVTVIISAFFIFAIGAVVRTRLKRSTTGAEGLCGATGVVRAALSPEGYVFVAGELWRARSLTGNVPQGTIVRVVDVEGLTITVEPEVSLTEPPGTGGGDSTHVTVAERQIPVHTARFAGRRTPGMVKES